MRVSRPVLFGIGVVSVFGGLSMAQTNQSAPAPAPQAVVRGGWFSTGPMGGAFLQPVTGAPYSADQTTEHLQTLADGTHITQTIVETKLYRDGMGRTRTERTLSPNGQSAAMVLPAFIDIVDPVAGYRYTLNPRGHTARRMTWSQPKWNSPLAKNTAIGPATRLGTAAAIITPAVSGAAVAATPAGRPRPETTRESLGSQNIEGVQATGTRTTTVYPEGSFGNDRPVTITFEIWTSPELKTTVLSTSSDPRYGDTTTKLTNIIQAEPDPSLFQIPDDYTLVDQQEPGGISFDPLPAKQ